MRPRNVLPVQRLTIHFAQTSEIEIVTFHLDNQRDLENAIRRLVRQDPRFQKILEQTGMPHLSRREPGLTDAPKAAVAHHFPG